MCVRVRIVFVVHLRGRAKHKLEGAGQPFILVSILCLEIHFLGPAKGRTKMAKKTRRFSRRIEMTGRRMEMTGREDSDMMKVGDCFE